MIDAESIFIYKAIKKCNKDIQIMIELVYNSNIEFLLNKNIQEQEFKYEFADFTILGDFAYISYLCLFIYLWYSAVDKDKICKKGFFSTF